MPGFFAELKRRKVYRVALGYIVAAWIVIQVVTQVLPLFLPTWAVKLTVVLVMLGLPVALILSWIFDLTPHGIERTGELKTSPATPLPRGPAAVPEKSIAVLPFENLSDDQANTYFADGIQDDILSNLAKVADLKVISRTSVRQYRGVERNLREIGADLGVAHILEGTVRRFGNRVRVNAQLINARSDAHVWAQTFDREIEDLFTLQSELAEQIAAALQANISPREMAGLKTHPTADLAAYELYLQARDLFRWSGAGDPRDCGERGLRLLEEALEKDPQFALAHALASRFHAELYWFGHDRSGDRMVRARREAETALRINPELGDARLALAYYHYYGGLEYDPARKQLALAREATPNDAEVWDAAGAIDRRQGKWEDAVANFKKAQQLDPLNPSVVWNLAETDVCLGRYEEARAAFGDGYEKHPNAHLFALGRAAIELKRDGNTAPLARALQEIPPDFDPGGAVSTVAVRLRLIQRDYEAAARLLSESGFIEFNDGGIGGTAGSLDGYAFPKAWYEGLVARGQGDVARAEHHFEVALRVVEADPRQCSCDAKTNCMMGLIYAALGRKEEALESGRRAAEMVPVSLDAYDGAMIATNLAVIYVESGERDLALTELERLVKLPNGPTPGTLRVEPEWNSLRDDPRFEKLLK